MARSLPKWLANLVRGSTASDVDNAQLDTERIDAKTADPAFQSVLLRELPFVAYMRTPGDYQDWLVLGRPLGFRRGLKRFGRLWDMEMRDIQGDNNGFVMGSSTPRALDGEDPVWTTEADVVEGVAKLFFETPRSHDTSIESVSNWFDSVGASEWSGLLRKSHPD